MTRVRKTVNATAGRGPRRRKTPGGSSPPALFSCFSREDVESVLREGADIDAVDENGHTALHRACRMNLLPVVEALLENKANASLPDGSGKAPLHNLLDPESWNNPTHQRVILKLLLQHGADPNAMTRNGQSPLHLAATKGNLEFCELLLQAGGDLGLRRRSGKTPADILRQKFPKVDSPWKERLFAAVLQDEMPVSPRTRGQRRI